MGTTLTREPLSTASIGTPLGSVAPGTASLSLADLLADAGTAIDALPADRIEQASAQIAAITSHLVDGAREAGAGDGSFAPSRETATVLSLRALGRLAARTAGHDVRLDASRARRIRDLVGALAA